MLNYYLKSSLQILEIIIIFILMNVICCFFSDNKKLSLTIM